MSPLQKLNYKNVVFEFTKKIQGQIIYRSSIENRKK